MAGEKKKWTWDVPGFDDDMRSRRYYVSPSSVLKKESLSVKLDKLKEHVKRAKDDCLELRQEANDLREYSNAKLDRVTRYLGVLADRARKLDQAALETEARITPLVSEKRRLFNDLLTAKGNVKVYCRVRPLFENEGSTIIEFPDDVTVRIDIGDDSLTNSKKNYEFDRVYGPHIGQGEFFHDVQPFVQSALDGYNVSIFAYGQNHSGKTHTMEGSSHDRGLFQRSFEELFDLSNSDLTSTAQYTFSVTAFELHNEQILDLLDGLGSSRIQLGPSGASVELVQENVVNPLDFSRVLKEALQNRGMQTNMSHMIITIHIQYTNYITRGNLYSKISLVDLAGSDCLPIEDASGDIIKDYLHVSKSLSALGDVLYSLTSQKETLPYENSMLTKLLSDSIGGDSKTLLVVHVCPNAANLSKTLSTLNFSARARNMELSLGNRDTIKKWKDVANDARKEAYEKENVILDLRRQVVELNIALKDANDQCTLLFNEVQKAWKVSFTLQADLKSENVMLSDKLKIEKEQNIQLKNQVSHLLQLEEDQKIQMHERDAAIETLQAKIKTMESQINESTAGSESGSSGVISTPKKVNDSADSSDVTRKLEEELAKRDALIEKLHEENEKLFNRLTEKASISAPPPVSSPSTKRLSEQLAQDANRRDNSNGRTVEVVPASINQDNNGNAGAIIKSSNEKPKTPAGEYLTASLMQFDPEQFESFAAIADGANKLLMLVLAAVIKAGAAREHEILAEIRDEVFAFIRKMEPKRVMDTMLVSRVRILYIRSLLARSPELQSIKVPPVERFLEKGNAGRSRSSSRGSSPGRSPVYYDSSSRNALVESGHIHSFKVNIKQDKKSKFSSIVLKLRGVEQETWRQHVTGGKLREITEEAKAYAIGNKSLAALFVHTPAGELQRQIRSWLAENFEFLSVTGGDETGGTTGQLELLSTAIMDGWMAGLGAAQPPNYTDALGQLLSEYTKRVYSSQLQHLKDIAGTLATEEAEDLAHVNKLRSALESVDVKRRKILQQMRSDTALLTKEEGGPPISNPSTAAEDARLASLISLDGMLKQVKEIMRQTSVNSLTKTKKKALLEALDELTERMPSLLDIDHPCAQRQILDARRVVESVPEQESITNDDSRAIQPYTPQSSANTETEVTQWNVLQFNTGATTPFIIKCGANSNSELVIKAEAKVQETKGNEIIRVVPKPSDIADMSFEEIKDLFDNLPEAISLLTLARTADGTRQRYARLYKTLADKVPALRDRN